jgi:hypothetical protein
MKRFLGMMLGTLMVPALAAAAVHARYRITLRDGSVVVASDTPVHRGSVVTFRDAESGALTGLPAEEIVSIQTGAAELAERPSPIDVIVRGERGAPLSLEGPVQPMRPGDVVVIGPTGGGATQPSSANGANAAGTPAMAGNGAYASPPVGAYGGAYAPGTFGGLQPMATPLPAASNPALTGQPPSIGPNGFPIMSGNPPTVGPSGTPISSSDQPVIGSNGTPALGAPAAGQPAIGPNGTPVLAPSGAPGSAQPVIGPNGTPVLATPGAPGSGQPAIGPNGTPILAPPGSPGAAPPNTAPNGTPAAPPPGAPHR